MIRLGALVPALGALRARLIAETVHSDDLPADYVRVLYSLPATAPVTSRVDQLWHENQVREASHG